MEQINALLEMEDVKLKNVLSLLGHLHENGATHNGMPIKVVLDHLSEFIEKTASEAKIKYLCPEDSGNGFHIFETISSNGENLGRLHMIDISDKFPCYYLAYVEVADFFRNRRLGLGSLMVSTFRNFLEERNAFGFLDNVIPPGDPTYEMYGSYGWKPLEQITAGINYMYYRPLARQEVPLSDLIELVQGLKENLEVIDIRSNELAVIQTLQEFSDTFKILLKYYEDNAEDDEKKQYAFTRFVTKLVGYLRRLKRMKGYTGGESAERIINMISKEIAGLKVKSYLPLELSRSTPDFEGDENLLRILRIEHEGIKSDPTRYIENLPNYKRPRLKAWMDENKKDQNEILTISDMLKLGFDPTRLKEIRIGGRWYVFERMPKWRLPELARKQEFLKKAVLILQNKKVKGNLASIHPVLVWIITDTDAYLLREKVDGVHFDEALEKLAADEYLAAMNKELKIDLHIRGIIREIAESLKIKAEEAKERLTLFIPWNFKDNTLDLLVEINGFSFQRIFLL